MILYEGCLIKLKNRREIFYVKGLVEENGKVIILPRYIPSDSGNRQDPKGQKYLVLKTLEEQLEYIRRKLPNLLRESRIFSTYLPMISEEDIDRVYYPTEKLREILREPRYSIDKTIIELVNLINKEVPLDFIGIAGSRLADLTGPDQDIDIVITDYRYVRKIVKILSKIKTPNNRKIESLAENHRKNLKTHYSILINILKRRILENIFKGYPYFIRILLMKDYKKCIVYRRVRYLSRIVTYCKIETIQNLSYTTPCIHKVHTGIGIRYLISDRGLFTDTLTIIDTFRVNGRVEIGEIYLPEIGEIIRKWIYLDSSSIISLP